MNNILVTGAAGFIGSNLVNHLANDKNNNVFGVDDMSNGHEEFVSPDVRLYKGISFSDEFILKSVSRGVFDYVIHLAARPRVSYSVSRPVETNDVNVTQTLKLIDACRTNTKRFIFASSSSVYGGADTLPTPETYIKDPKSPYALQKSIIEDYLSQYALHYDMDSICLRFFNVFGPHSLGGTPYSTAINSWLTSIMKGEKMRSDGDGSQSRDVCYVDNVIQACELAMNHEKHSNAECYNVATGERVTNNQIMQRLKEMFPNAQHYDAPWREGDVMHTQADITKIKSELGYKDPISVWQGLDNTAKWYVDNWHWIKDLRVSM